ncbi:MAG: hypothetical protein ACYC27_16195 [Armatimonadota bacterium]
MNDKDQFRNLLLAAQDITPELRERYNKEVQSIMHKKLALVQRLGFGISTLVGLAAIGICVWVLFTQPMIATLKVVVGMLGLVALVVTIVRGVIATTGTVNLKLHATVIANVAWVGIILAVVIIQITVGLNYPVSVEGLYMVIASLIPLIITVAKVTQIHISQSDLSTREELLEIKLRLAEISESLANKTA